MTETFTRVWEWICDNKEWFFNVLGSLIVIGVVGYYYEIKLKKRKKR